MKKTSILSIILSIILSLFLIACSKPLGPVAEIGDLVTIEYKATFADGSLFDRSEDYDEPVTFTIGNREVLIGLERTVIGMRQGETKKVLLAPEAAYGLDDLDKIELIPLEEFPEGSHLRVGMSLPAKDRSNGEQIQGTIINITSEGVLVDFNHPLAGESLWMEIMVKDVMKG